MYEFQFSDLDCNHDTKAIATRGYVHAQTVCRIMADDLEFLPLEKSKSIIWTYFGFPARN